jgi:endogenous inhibitor of DNA gyrase (YacG/DUF329 family)
MSEPPRIVSCPTCSKAVKWSKGNEYRPFCSNRCRLIDFGSWAGEQHRLPGDADTDELFSEDDQTR